MIQPCPSSNTLLAIRIRDIRQPLRRRPLAGAHRMKTSCRLDGIMTRQCSLSMRRVGLPHTQPLREAGAMKKGTAVKARQMTKATARAAMPTAVAATGSCPARSTPAAASALRDATDRFSEAVERGGGGWTHRATLQILRLAVAHFNVPHHARCFVR